MIMRNKLQCMIRMDDITAGMNWEKFNQIKDIFEQYQIAPLLGVVPDNQDGKLCIQEAKEDFWEVLRELQKNGWMIAQHGTYHKYVTKDGGILQLKDASEFAGVSYEEQFAKLQNGRRILMEKGIQTDIFMAPGHTYDRNTLKALHELGFRTVTDGLYSKPYYDEGLLFIPCRLQEYHRVKGIDTICLHSNNMSDSDIRKLEEFCKKNIENIIPFSADKMEKHAVKRTIYVVCSERITLIFRRTKNHIANSKRLAWYMQYTNDKNSKKKWLKRICCLPLLFGREK